MIKTTIRSILCILAISLAISCAPAKFELGQSPITKRLGQNGLLVEGRPVTGVLFAVALPDSETSSRLSLAMEKQWGLGPAEGFGSKRRPTTVLQSKQFNVGEDGSYSVMRTVVFGYQGREVTPVSLVFVDRKDVWKDWGREFHTGIVMPFKTWNENPLLTETDLKWVQQALGESAQHRLLVDFLIGVDNEEIVGDLVQNVGHSK